MAPILIERFLNIRLDAGVSLKTAVENVKAIGTALKRAERCPTVSGWPLPFDARAHWGQRCRMLWRFGFFPVRTLFFLMAPILSGQEAPNFGGGTRPEPLGPCVPLGDRLRINRDIRAFFERNPEAALRSPPSGAQRYPFFPQAGQIWGDLFPNNFVDLNNSSGVLDYNGTDYTYNDHHGIDTDICTFTEKNIGVPVFAALDGVITSLHDGEPDENISQPNVPANYVVLSHGGTHDTWYYHLKNGSVAVSPGQHVKAGQQLGLTASSGFSSGPHLHFESRFAGTYYEPFTGASNPGTSGWVNQPAFRGEMYVRDFNITTEDLSSWYGPPIDTTRIGTFRMGSRNHKFWFIAQSFPASSTYRIRYLRPNGSVANSNDSGSFGNAAFFKWSYWWFSRTISFNVTGTWTLELSI
ncbi:MAG: M23 family metallopeptidase, partial [Verrucomicrobiae bacterium]|nr:M23 family metallopeptidase [Verrucomicrobiae bacterium]